METLLIGLFVVGAILIVVGVAMERGVRAEHVRAVIAAHPAPARAWIETALWALMLVALVDHLRDPQHGPTAFIAWALTIGPHEIGHLLCLPFGWVLHVAGGSLWQILWWAGLALVAGLLRRRVDGMLVFLAVTGHSFINLSLYIMDARARALPLLFGMDSSHHDWWNLLHRADLLAYDHALGWAARLIGAGLVLGASLAGIVVTWTIPGGRWTRTR